MKANQIKLLTIGGFAVLLTCVVGFKTNGILTVQSSDTDPAAVYKKSCAVCHTAKAEKFFDLDKPDEEHVEAILKGKKGAKPPFMPEYASKGITPEQAKELTLYMRRLRTPGSANTNAAENAVNSNAANSNAANSNAAGNANTNATVDANANTNATVNANANANITDNANANGYVNANAVVNGNANAAGNSNTAYTKTPAAELAAIYKKSCVMCHSPKAEKAYDPLMPIEEQINAILNGKKAAKPPHMPAFAGKGITPGQAGELAEYMKALRAAGK